MSAPCFLAPSTLCSLPQAPHGPAGLPRPGLSARPAAAAACRRGPCSAWRGAGQPRAASCSRSPQPPRPATLTSAPLPRREVPPARTAPPGAPWCRSTACAATPPTARSAAGRAPRPTCEPSRPLPGHKRHLLPSSTASGASTPCCMRARWKPGHETSCWALGPNSYARVFAFVRACA